MKLDKSTVIFSQPKNQKLKKLKKKKKIIKKKKRKKKTKKKKQGKWPKSQR